MALLRCTSCTTLFSVGAPRCPQCGSTDNEEDGMPKIAKDQGASYEGHVDVSAGETVTPEWKPAEQVNAEGAELEVTGDGAGDALPPASGDEGESSGAGTPPTQQGPTGAPGDELELNSEGDAAAGDGGPAADEEPTAPKPTAMPARRRTRAKKD